MGTADRRGSLKLAIGAAILPFVGARPVLAATSDGGNIAPPDCQMIYRRKMDRQFPGGSDHMVVARDFAVNFSPAMGGYEVTGQQVAARVDVPAHLEQLGELERQRVEEGIFPLLLSPQGLIINGTATAPTHQLERALEDVRNRFADGGEELGVLLDALHGANARVSAELPQDLFAPERGMSEQQQEIELPWGDKGEVITQFAASRDPETRLMRRAERLVLTRLGGEERRSVESWELFPA